MTVAGLISAYNVVRSGWSTYNAAKETVDRYQEIASQHDPVSWGQVVEVAALVNPWEDKTK